MLYPKEGKSTFQLHPFVITLFTIDKTGNANTNKYKFSNWSKWIDQLTMECPSSDDTCAKKSMYTRHKILWKKLRARGEVVG